MRERTSPSFRSKLFLYVFSLLLLVTCIFVVFDWFRVRNILIKNTISELKNLLSAELSFLINSLSLLKVGVIIGITNESEGFYNDFSGMDFTLALKKRFENLLGVYPEIEDIWLVDLDKYKIIVSATGLRDNTPVPLNLYCRCLHKQKKGYRISDVSFFVDYSYTKERPYLFMLIRCKDIGYKFDKYFIVVKVNMRNIFDRLYKVYGKKESGIYFYFITKSGLPLVDVYYRKDVPYSFPVVSPVLYDATYSLNSSIYTVSPDVDVVGVYKYLPQFGMIVVAEKLMVDILKEVDNTVLRYLYMLFVIFVFLGVVLWWLSGLISKEIFIVSDIVSVFSTQKKFLLPKDFKLKLKETKLLYESFLNMLKAILRSEEIFKQQYRFVFALYQAILKLQVVEDSKTFINKVVELLPEILQSDSLCIFKVDCKNKKIIALKKLYGNKDDFIFSESLIDKLEQNPEIVIKEDDKLRIIFLLEFLIEGFDVCECYVVESISKAYVEEEWKKEFMSFVIESLRVTYEVVFLRERLREMSIKDDLTGVYNRRFLLEILENELNRVKRYDTVFSLCYLDLDGFKALNDKYGHIYGDEILRRVGSILRNTIRSNLDIPARYGGDEFCVVLPNIAVKGACSFAERLRKKIEETFEGKITVSIGVTAARKDDTVNSIVFRADKLMYKAKRLGGNKVVCD